VRQDFWDGLAALLSEHFQKGEFTEGLIRAIEAAGEKLVEHFPYDAVSDVNELSDEIDFSRSRKK
jgi:uncharacterized membrane protein